LFTLFGPLYAHLRTEAEFRRRRRRKSLAPLPAEFWSARVGARRRASRIWSAPAGKRRGLLDILLQIIILMNWVCHWKKPYYSHVKWYFA